MTGSNGTVILLGIVALVAFSGRNSLNNTLQGIDDYDASSQKISYRRQALWRANDEAEAKHDVNIATLQKTHLGVLQSTSSMVNTHYNNTINSYDDITKSADRLISSVGDIFSDEEDEEQPDQRASQPSVMKSPSPSTSDEVAEDDDDGVDLTRPVTHAVYAA